MSLLGDAGYSPPGDLAFEVAGRQLRVVDWLRMLPGRRFVARCQAGVVAKLFVGRTAASACAAERLRLEQLRTAGCPVPATLGHGQVDADTYALLLEEVVPTRAPTADDLVAALAQLHDAGFLQQDPHPGNFLVRGDTCVLVDAGGIRAAGRIVRAGREITVPSMAACLENLGRLLAEMPTLTDAGIVDLYRVYRRARRRDLSGEARLARAVDNNRRLLLDARVRKSERDCTHYRRVETPALTGVARRDAHWLAALLDDPQAVFDSGRIVKRGNAASVARVDLGEHCIALKRYRSRTFGHRLRRSLRASRARRSWRSAQRLLQLQVPCAEPLVVLQARGVLAGVDWFACEWIDGEPLDRAVGSMDAATLAACAAQLAEMWRRMHAVELVHGDAKASNYLWRQGRLYLIDLDPVRFSDRGRQRDRERLLANFDGEVRARRAFEAALAPLYR